MDYEYVNRISSGGFGVVDKVKDNNGVLYAKKSFSPSIPLDPKYYQISRTRFLREAYYQKDLASKSQYIMPIYKLVDTATELYYIMPLAENTLAESGLVFSVIRSALFDTLNGLQVIHENRLVHRDLKPQNILLYNGKWCVSDFGLVMPPAENTTVLTTIGASWFSESYCSPEQRRNTHEVDSTTDVFAFGCIVHDFFGDSHRVPYAQCTAAGPMGAIIRKCTEQDPKRRFRGVPGLRAALVDAYEMLEGSEVSHASGPFSERLKSFYEWTVDDLSEFEAHLASSEGVGEYYNLLNELTGDFVRHAFTVDVYKAKSIAAMQCAYIASSSFNFDFCDVLVTRLEVIFSCGDNDSKKDAIIAAAQLGYNHNRWYVMERLLKMAGESLDEHVAWLVGIEIKSAKMQHIFNGCATRINRTAANFHKRISSAISNEGDS